MAGDLSSGAKCVKYTLFFFNLLFLVSTLYHTIAFISFAFLNSYELNFYRLVMLLGTNRLVMDNT